MNIKKKISFFALFLISSFFIVGEVKGEGKCKGCGCNSGEVCVRIAGGTNEYYDNYIAANGQSSYDSNGVYVFRITLVDQNGNRYKNNGKDTASYDYYVNSDSRLSGNYTYNGYKYSSGNSFNTTYTVGRSYEIEKSSNDDFSKADGILNFWKNKLGVGNSNLTKDMKVVLRNAGISTDVAQKKAFESGKLYLVIERIFKVTITTVVPKEDCPIVTVKKQAENCMSGCQNIPEASKREECYNSCYVPYTIKRCDASSLFSSTSFVGTGKATANLLNSYYNGNSSYGISAGKINQLDFLRSNVFVNDIGRMRIDNLKDINSWNFKSKQLSTVSSPATWNPGSQDGRENKWKELADSNKTVDLLVLKIWAGSETIPMCDEKNHKSLGRDYNEKYTNPKDKTHCCDAGKKYNPKRNDCETVETKCTKNNYINLGRSYNTTLKKCCLPGQNLKKGKPQKVTSCFTKDSAPTNYDYNYYCYTQSNMCSKNKVNSTINSYVTTVKNGPTSMYTKGPTQSNLTDNQSGECILNNSAYYVGTVNGTKIYCSDSLETSLSGMISNLQVKSGTFMPVSSPTITVNHNCYFTLANHSAKEPYTTNIKDIYSEFTSPSINLNFMNKDYTFNGSSSSVDTGTLSAQSKETAYGAKYYTYSFTTTYTPGYSSTLLNKYVDKKTATGSGDSFAPINGMAFNQMSKNINISIPTDAKGTYSAKYTLGSNSYSNPAINKILSNSTTTLKTSYDTKKTVECGGTCKIEYSSKFLNCESTGSLIKEIFQNGYGNDLRISNTKDSCKFTMQFPVGSKAECTRAKGTLKTLTATYTKDSCTQKVVFNTSVTGADSSCSNSVTVENIDIKEDLVFRPISLSNPFPGQNGKGRSMGSPWTDDLKKTYITNRSNVYSKKPLYSITLTPSSIKQIRDYNKKNSYDDFNLTCSNGEACYSAFLRSAEYSKIVNTNKSNCYNANDRSVNAFNSCADYSKRT